MSNTANQLNALLRQHDFRLVRQNKHYIWRSRDGVIWVTAATPSDVRAIHNQLKSLKRALAANQRSEILAVTEYERAQAALCIAPQQKSTTGVSGAGRQSRSSGTGFTYYTPDPIEKVDLRIQSPEDALDYFLAHRLSLEDAAHEAWCISETARIKRDAQEAQRVAALVREATKRAQYLQKRDVNRFGTAIKMWLAPHIAQDVESSQFFSDCADAHFKKILAAYTDGVTRTEDELKAVHTAAEDMHYGWRKYKREHGKELSSDLMRRSYTDYLTSWAEDDRLALARLRNIFLTDARLFYELRNAPRKQMMAEIDSRLAKYTGNWLTDGWREGLRKLFLIAADMVRLQPLADEILTTLMRGDDHAQCELEFAPDGRSWLKFHLPAGHKKRDGNLLGYLITDELHERGYKDKSWMAEWKRKHVAPEPVQQEQQSSAA